MVKCCEGFPLTERKKGVFVVINTSVKLEAPEARYVIVMTPGCTQSAQWEPYFCKRGGSFNLIML